MRTRNKNTSETYNDSVLTQAATSELVVNKALDVLSRVGEQERELVRSVQCALTRQQSKERSSATVCFLFDSGSDAHITNKRDVFIKGTTRKCDVNVYGINEDDSVDALKATECGSVLYDVAGVSIVIDNVLFVPSAVLGNHPRIVLVSVSGFIERCGLGIHFPEGGKLVEFTTGKGSDISVVDTFKSDSTMFCDFKSSRQQRKTKTLASKTKARQDKNSKQTDKQTEVETKETVVDDDSTDVGEKHSREVEKEGKEAKEKKKKRMSREQRKKLVQRLHNRMHFGKTQHVLSTLRKIYGVDANDMCDGFEESCDACAWTKAKMGPASKHSHRKATRVGERLHYDLFSSSIRTKDGIKYLLVVIDEYSDFVWAFGLRHKSETKQIIEMLIKRIEKRTGYKVLSYRCDNARENKLDDESLESESSTEQPKSKRESREAGRCSVVGWTDNPPRW